MVRQEMEKPSLPFPPPLRPKAKFIPQAEEWTLGNESSRCSFGGSFGGESGAMTDHREAQGRVWAGTASKELVTVSSLKITRPVGKPPTHDRPK